MTGFVRARFAAIAFILSAAIWPVADARADVFLFNGEIYFCSTTCNSFGALGGATGGSSNTTNSVVIGSLDIPVMGDGTFSFVAGDNVPFNFTITTSAIGQEDPVIGPVDGCPPPNAAGQICNPTTVNPLPLDGSVATIAGSGVVGPDGNFVSGSLTFVFTVPPFSNNGAVVTFNLAPVVEVDAPPMDPVGPRASGTVFGGAVVFTRINGDFVPAPPELAVSMPVPDPFPDTLVGDTSTATVTVTNSGLGNAAISLGTGSLAAPFSIAADGCSSAPLTGGGATCTIDIDFAPTVEGAAAGSFTVDAANNDPASITVNLVGNAIVPEIDVMPVDVVFPDVLLGASATLDVIVTNTGSADLDIPLGGVTALTDPFAISADGCSDTMVAPLGSCTISVTFTPTVAESASGMFDIASNDPNEPTVTVTVSGAGAAPDISVMPQTLGFPSILTGQSQTRDVTITNDGSADLEIGTIDALSIVAPFALVSDGCSTMTLAPGGTCTLMIEFSPTAEGMFTNDYDIPSNDPDEDVFAASLEGTATAAPESFITVAPAALSLGDVIVSQINMGVITVTNDGSADLVVTDAVITGTNADEYSQTTDCATVAPNAQCTITVTFAPGDQGARVATLTVESDAANATSVDVELSGNGVLGPQITLAVATLSFGNANEPVELDQSIDGTVMVISSGSTNAIVSGLALSGEGAGEFAIASENCTAGPLAPMQTCDVVITFAPTTAGDKSAVLTVTSDDVDMRDQTVALTGFVLAGSRPELSVPELEIGTSTDPVTIGETGESEIEITNTGTDALLFVSIVLAGADAAEFSLTEDCTAVPVDRNESCTIGVTFEPATPGTKSAEVQITTDSVTTRRALRAVQVTVVPIMATAVSPPPPPPPPAGSQTRVPPAHATGDAGSEGACFIATAAYGSYLDPNVQVLRDFRDHVLLRTSVGREFVQFYYANSPMLADYIARHEGARTATRVALTPLVYAMAYPLPALCVLLAAFGMLRYRRRARLPLT